MWQQRGAAAYMGLNRTDPDAIWSFQGGFKVNVNRQYREVTPDLVWQ